MNRVLLEFTAEAMTSQGSTADDFQALADLRYGAERFDGSRISAFIGIGKLTLLYDPSGCQIVIGSRHGDDGKTAGVKTISGGWELTPATGVVLSDKTVEVLAHFLRTQGGDAPKVKFEASVDADDLHAVLSGEAAEAPEKNRAIVDRYLVRKAYPRKGVISLGWASISWVPKR